MGRNPNPLYLPDFLPPPSAFSPTTESPLIGRLSDCELEGSKSPKAASFPGCPGCGNFQGQRQGRHAMYTCKTYSWEKSMAILSLAKQLLKPY